MQRTSITTHLVNIFLAIVVLAFLPLSTYAIDAKFELDPKLLDNKTASHSPQSLPKEQVKKTLTSKQSPSGSKRKKHLKPSIPSHQIKMVTMVRSGGDGNTLEMTKKVWNRLIAPGKGDVEPFNYSSTAFSLSLDPELYPLLPAVDGGRILVDGAAALPPLVKSLIQEKVPGIRFVEENPKNRQRFFKSLLSVAGFYSVEDDFTIDFGVDPKITVNADFKIEKNAESLLRQDITLLNLGENQHPMPSTLLKLLEGKGFRMIEASSSVNAEGRGGAEHSLCRITSNEPKAIADSLLRALAVPFDTGRNIDLYSEKDAGIKLEVRADRYFEDDGRRFVIALFDGDPVSYTLIRLLETRGYRVIMLQAGDTFRTVAENVLARMQIQGGYGGHDLWPIRNVGYGVNVSGIMIRDKGKMGRNIFLTDKKMDPLIVDLAEANGYHIVNN